VFGATHLGVNHMHHQAVRDVAPGLKAVAWTDDGTIEALERADDRQPWLLMVQFHPEELVETHQPSQRLFSAFIEACRARIAVPATSLR
jgi:putative glutamine amidotransferase